MLPGAASPRSQPTRGVNEPVWISWTPLAVSSPSQQLRGHLPHVVRAGRAGPEYSASFQLYILCLRSCSLLPKKSPFREGRSPTHCSGEIWIHVSWSSCSRDLISVFTLIQLKTDKICHLLFPAELYWAAQPNPLKV